MSLPPATIDAPIVPDPRWTAVQARDASVDGQFCYSVSTTGIYCRPSCPSRLCRPEHVAFHATPAAAERAGFRPCKRCQPDQAPAAIQRAGVIAGLCRLIEAREPTDPTPSLVDLARHTGWSVFHTQRQFKAVTGVTPKAYAAAHRARRVDEALRSQAGVTDAIYAAGYNSTGRFYEDASRTLGMTPSRYRSGGAGETIRFATGACALGTILVAATDRGICSIALGDDADIVISELTGRFPRAELRPAAPDFAPLLARVIAVIEGDDAGADLPIDVRGTAFQLRVWQALREIPRGETTSYANIAARLGADGAARAVARACASNPVAVAIPCHRVVRSDGQISGYRWGVERKKLLLARESKP